MVYRSEETTIAGDSVNSRTYTKRKKKVCYACEYEKSRLERKDSHWVKGNT